MTISSIYDHVNFNQLLLCTRQMKQTLDLTDLDGNASVLPMIRGMERGSKKNQTIKLTSRRPLQ
jgi:hypothetical protein